jgi:hypothetical protein
LDEGLALHRQILTDGQDAAGEAKPPQQELPRSGGSQGRGMFPACIKLSVVLAAAAWAVFLTIALWAPRRGYVDVVNLWSPVWGWPVLFLCNFLFAAAVSRFKEDFGRLWLGEPDENGETLRIFVNGAVVALAAVVVAYSVVVLVTIVRKPISKDHIGQLPGVYRTDPDVVKLSTETEQEQ